VAGEPDDPLVACVGAASGGLFETADGSVTWTSIFDEQSVSSIGSVALTPGAPNVVWVGTGETFFIRRAHAMGSGLYRSDDRARTWQHVGLDKTGRIGRVVIDPRNPNTVFACALGHAYGPDRGVFRTHGGGASISMNRGLTYDRVVLSIAQMYNSVYVGSQYVHRTTNGGQSWEVISPDLTLDDKSHHQNSRATPSTCGTTTARRFAP
jgi:hypothetical protein